MTVRDVIKLELKRQMPGTEIKSIYGSYSMRFELGGEGNTSSAARISQATERGTEIFFRLFGRNETVIVIKEWQDDFLDPHNKYKNYIYTVLKNIDLKRISGPFDQIYHEVGEEGVKIERTLEEQLQCDLLIGRVALTDDQLKSIIKGLAAYEMGERPAIPQDITFLSVPDDTGFRMYDDRGCDIWSNSLTLLRPMYISTNDWILNYNRREIDLMFN